MKAITISQPFASLIANGDKFVENRTWPTTYRGPLAIHAGKGTQYLCREELALYPTGCIIAIVELVACIARNDLEILKPNDTIESRRVVDIRNHRYTEGPWCWILEDAKPILHVAINGKQGLWEWDAGEVAGV